MIIYDFLNVIYFLSYLFLLYRIILSFMQTNICTLHTFGHIIMFSTCKNDSFFDKSNNLIIKLSNFLTQKFRIHWYIFFPYFLTMCVTLIPPYNFFNHKKSIFFFNKTLFVICIICTYSIFNKQFRNKSWTCQLLNEFKSAKLEFMSGLKTTIRDDSRYILDILDDIP